MTEKLFNVIRYINSEDLRNNQWELVANIESTLHYFGTIVDTNLQGAFIAIWAEIGSWEQDKLHSLEPDLILVCRDCNESIFFFDCNADFNFPPTV